jgi:hypothetical protein
LGTPTFRTVKPANAGTTDGFQTTFRLRGP